VPGFLPTVGACCTILKIEKPFAPELTVTLVEQLHEAIETGELLTVVYHGGHAPGAKRKIVPRRIHEDLVYAKDFGETQIKSYKLGRMELSSNDAPAPWVHELAAKQTFQKIDAATHFSTWEFEIHRALWPALGVDLRQYIDKERTKAAREEAKQRGETNLTKIAHRYLAHAVSENPVLDFHEGDVFPSKKSEGVFLQVIGMGEYVEVHQIIIQSPARRLAFHVTDTELAAWLRTGKTLANSRIGKGQSYSEVLRFNIEDPV
jgi:hypothetical protein